MVAGTGRGEPAGDRRPPDRHPAARQHPGRAVQGRHSSRGNRRYCDSRRGRQARGSRQGIQDGPDLGKTVREKAASAAMAMEGQLADLAGATQLSKQLQTTRNQQALANWQTYLAELTAAKVNPPAAATIKNPSDLPSGLTAVQGRRAASPGRRRRRQRPDAQSACCRPRRSGRSTKRSALMGKPYGVSAGPARTSTAVSARHEPPGSPTRPSPASRQRLRRATSRSPPRRSSRATSCVMGSRSVGLFHVGIALDNAEMIAADEAKGSVVVTSIPDSLYAALRPTLGKPAKAQIAPATTRSASAFRCGNTATSIDVGTGAWTWPLAEGTYEIGTPYGQSGPCGPPASTPARTSRPPLGTPVRAVTAGSRTGRAPGLGGQPGSHRPRQRPGDALRAPERGRRSRRHPGAVPVSASAPSVRKATRPARTCTSKYASVVTR